MKVGVRSLVVKRRLGILAAVAAIASFVLTGGSAYAVSPPFFDEEGDQLVSGALEFRDVPASTNVTECPQAGLSGDRAHPLDKRSGDRAEQKSTGTDQRLNQDFACFPQDETVVDQNPKAPRNYLAGANDYRMGWGTSGFYATTDGGAHWYDGITPFPSLPSGDNLDGGGDPVTLFDRAGVAYYAQISFNRTDDTSGVWVNRSTNGGFTWTRPCVAFEPTSTATEDQAVCGGAGDVRQPGDGTVGYIRDNDNSLNGSVPAFDKEWITAGRRPTGVTATCFTPLTHTPTACDPAVVGVDRLYVTYSLFSGAGSAQIFLSYSDDQARSWSPPHVINGSAEFCAAGSRLNNACDDSQGSQPTANPTPAQPWVGFLHGVPEASDQYLGAT